MVLTRQKSDGYVLNRQSSADNMHDLKAFMSKMLIEPEAANFTSDISILDDLKHKFIAVRDKKTAQIVAYALLRQEGPDAELEQLYSAQSGKGYGRVALKTAEAYAKAQGAKVLWLNSVPKATPFYTKCGYQTVNGQRFTKRL